MAKSLPIAAVLLLLGSGAANAQGSGWFSGWAPPPGSPGIEKLNLNKSGVIYATAKGRLEVLYSLVGAQPDTIYQVGLHLFGTKPELCPTPNLPNSRFGTFRASGGGGCILVQAFNGSQTVTANGYSVELGAVLTDRNGTGEFFVIADKIPKGTYRVKFHIRRAPGHHLTGGVGGSEPVIFQAPGKKGGNRKDTFLQQEEIKIP